MLLENQDEKDQELLKHMISQVKTRYQAKLGINVNTMVHLGQINEEEKENTAANSPISPRDNKTNETSAQKVIQVYKERLMAKAFVSLRQL